jgi:hypothetical protein
MKKKAKPVTVASLKRELLAERQWSQARAEQEYSRGYNEGRAHVTNVLRELLGIAKL